MALVAFMQAGSTSVYAGSWRHPATEHGYLDASYYAKIGRQLEEGCFDLMFFYDRLAMPGIYGGSVADAVKYGARPVKLDLSIVLGVLAQATSHIGLGATGSTTYYTPFHIARTFATLEVYIPPSEYILALKLFAGRPKDRDDSIILCQQLQIRTRAQAQRLVDRYIPDTQLQLLNHLDETLDDLFP